MCLRQIIATGIGVGLACLPLGCTDSQAVATSTTETVCVDTQSKEVVLVSDAAAYPTLNSRTGTKSLVPALYCPKCRVWHATPSAEQIQRQRGVAHCPKTGIALVAEGPLPPEARKQP